LANEISEKDRLADNVLELQREIKEHVIREQKSSADLLNVKNELNSKINLVKQEYED